jgi:mannose/fructose/N-acetylgalactosamine-specific phosphotransferase system component IID
VAAKDVSSNVDLRPEKITKRDNTIAAARWWFACEMSNNFERLQHLAFCYSMLPILKKLYKKKEDLVEALQRHMNFFNTQGIWGTIIHGTVVAMEEQKANGAPVTGEAITAFKTGLMGPLAGIGDTMDWLTFLPLILSFFIPVAAAGSWIASPGIVVAFLAISLPELYFFWHSGYRLGQESISNLLESGQIRSLMDGCGVLGTFMMGALGSTFVKVSTPITWTSGEIGFSLQGILDKIVPGLLPLAAVMGVYLYLDLKQPKYTTVVLWLLGIGLVAGTLGIL